MTNYCHEFSVDSAESESCLGSTKTLRPGPAGNYSFTGYARCPVMSVDRVTYGIRRSHPFRAQTPEEHI